jgi:acetyl/propionyl-CoA carboxylase alpha subunit
VEFLLDRSGDFFFLEMNTRLQVEHPVTEAVTGLDLVRLQIEVAQGDPLPLEAIAPSMQGHAVEVRLYAEDPAKGYLPVTGIVEQFELEDVRVDTGVGSGSEIPVFYDPMIAKVIAHGATRPDAIRRLVRSLRGGAVHGLTTNLGLLVRVLESEAFAAGETDTEFLDRIDPAEWSRPLIGEDDRHAMALAAAVAGQAERRLSASVLQTLPSGWRNSPSQLNPVTLDDDLGTIDLGYRIDADRVEISIDGENLPPARLHAATPEIVDLTVGDVRRRYRVQRRGSQVFVRSPIGGAGFTERPMLPVPQPDADPGSLLAPMPGKVVRVAAITGETVDAGTALIIIEAMKMEHTITAPISGTVTAIAVKEGEQVDTGQVLATVERAMGADRGGG